MRKFSPVLIFNPIANRLGSVIPIAALLLATLPGFAATLTVTNSADSGAGTLRQAIVDAASGDTIGFAISGTILLTTGELAINANLSIVGPGQTSLIIQGRPNFSSPGTRVFKIAAVTANISGLTIANGYSNDAPGGGIYNAGTLTLDHCELLNNVASEAAGGQIYGGAIYNLGGTLLVNHCSFRTNGVGSYGGHGSSPAGGAIYNNGGSVTLNNSTFSDNSAVGAFNVPASGGSLYNNAGTLSVNNCTLARNYAANNSLQSVAAGGAIYNAGTLSVSNSTVAGNYTSGAPSQFGGGVYHSVGTLNLQNTIVANNFTSGSASPDVRGVIASQGFNLIGQTNGSSGWIATDLTGSAASPLNPILGPLMNHGGPTFTMALPPGSPAVDAGYSGGIPTDQRGQPRRSDNPVFPNAPGGDGSDIGAYEIGLNLNVTVVGGGAVFKRPDQFGYAYNQTVTLTAIPAPGWRFSTWSGNASGSANPLNVVMNTDKTITANFTPTDSVFNGANTGPIPDSLGPGFTNYNGGARVISFNVAGLCADIRSMSLSLTLNHTYVGDLDVFLTSPQGTNFTIFSRVASSTPFAASLNLDGTYNFNDSATNTLRMVALTVVDTNTIPGGDYRTTVAGPWLETPTTFGADSGFVGLAPAQANGVWTLTVRDGARFDEGTVSAATLIISTTCESPSGLVTWWPGAGNANDVIGNNNGTLQNGAAFAAGKVGQAFSFDGVNDHIVIPGFGTNVPTTEITVEFWQKANNMVPAQSTTFALPYYMPGSGFNAFVPYINGVVYWDFGDVNSGGRLSYTPPVSIVGSWQHFALVASQSGNYMRIYRNGVLEAAKSGMTPFVRINYDLLIGYPFSGLIDELSIYNRALSATEIANLYTAGSVGKCLTPLYITSLSKSGSNVNLSWLAQKGMGYRAQSSTNLNAATLWTDVSGDVTATGASASKSEVVPANEPQRFYRVKLLP